jgi:hypothetical protein
MDTNPCMLDKKILMDWVNDTRGGKSNVDEKMANNISARVQSANMRGS